jgi:hypothetical protein
MFRGQVQCISLINSSLKMIEYTVLHIFCYTKKCFIKLYMYLNRGTFQIDGNRKQKKRTEGDSCQKRYPGHPSLLPGIFTMFCPHISKMIGIFSCNAVANTGSSLFWTSKTVSNIDCTSGTGFIKEQTDDCDDKQNSNF